MAKPTFSFPRPTPLSSPRVQVARRGVSVPRDLVLRSVGFGTWAGVSSAYFLWNVVGWAAALPIAFAVGVQVAVIWVILERRVGPSGIIAAIHGLVVTIGIKTVPVFFIEIGWGAWLFATLVFIWGTIGSFFFAIAVNTAVCSGDPRWPGELAHTMECQRAVDASNGWACGIVYLALPVILVLVLLHYRALQGIKFALGSNPKDPGAHSGMFDPDSAYIRDIESRAFQLIVDSALVPFLTILICTFLVIVFADSAMVKAFGGFPADPWTVFVMGLFVIPLWIWRTVSFGLLIIRSL